MNASVPGVAARGHSGSKRRADRKLASDLGHSLGRLVVINKD